MKTMKLKGIGKDLLGMALLFLFLLLFLFNDSLNNSEMLNNIPSALINVNTIFLSIVLEAIPFILLGVFISSLIQIYVSEETLQRFIPKNAIAALIPAALLGAILPLCECAIVPVVRRLIKKGMPLHIGVVFLVAAPILNPIVFASTYFAFKDPFSQTNTVLYSRMGLAFVLSIIIGAIFYAVFKNNSQQLRGNVPVHHDHSHQYEEKKPTIFSRIRDAFYHAVDEFFMMGKYLIIGAFIAALFQTFLNRDVLQSIGTNDYSSTMVMMGFAYLLSLCSEADAFVASSFRSSFSEMSLVAFLVYGPMLDLKNTFMLFALFKSRFVLVFIVTVTIVVFAAIAILYGIIL
ncbi:hypothetical protein SAMN05421736_102356 [Evansella caseinilytica]|uniref:Permease n=1 Tax=Evansella caseinilytica TaxID=1503961 RepID=A0A1H3L4F0_9BACI|nr:permease [Evansella caseinilytica]SDY59281.1 hypothetical protein SAMN05421736_102356 [Evansella caseinilytica]